MIYSLEHQVEWMGRESFRNQLVKGNQGNYGY